MEMLGFQPVAPLYMSMRYAMPLCQSVVLSYMSMRYAVLLYQSGCHIMWWQIIGRQANAGE